MAFFIPTCHIKRVRASNPFKGIGDFGYCAAKDNKYFGFKGHIVTHTSGVIVEFVFASAHIDERDVLPELVENYQGMIIADKGLISAELSQNLLKHNLNLQTPLRSNMKDDRPKSFVQKLTSVRRKIETVIGQLTQRFQIQSIRAKDPWHLAAKLGRKILAHTFGCYMAGSLKLDGLIS